MLHLNLKEITPQVIKVIENIINRYKKRIFKNN